MSAGNYFWRARHYALRAISESSGMLDTQKQRLTTFNSFIRLDGTCAVGRPTLAFNAETFRQRYWNLLRKSKMSSDLLRICDPASYYSQFILESIYPDGRSIDSFRQVSLQMGVADSSPGSSLARQGGATVTCKVEPFIAALSDAPSIVPHIEGAPVIPQSVIEDAEAVVDQLIEQNAFCTKDSLKTANGRLMWVLHLHIMILNVDGSVLDALSTCISGALVDLRLPSVTSVFEEDVPINLKQVDYGEEWSHIELSDIPVSSTFITYSISDEKETILCDPGWELFRVAPRSVTVVVGNNARIHRIIQRGLCGLASLRQMVNLAIGRQKIVAESLFKARDIHRSRERTLCVV